MNIEDILDILNSDQVVDIYCGDRRVWIENVNEENENVQIRYIQDNHVENVHVSKIRYDNSLMGEITEFINENNYGVLATTYECFPLSSPVEYYTNDKKEIFIPSIGGNKFKNLGTNNNVCLLVNTDYKDITKIKGVQIFGKASVLERNTTEFEQASGYIDDPDILSYDNARIIKISPVKMIYLNSMRSGEKDKYEIEFK